MVHAMEPGSFRNRNLKASAVLSFLGSVKNTEEIPCKIIIVAVIFLKNKNKNCKGCSNFISF